MGNLIIYIPIMATSRRTTPSNRRLQATAAGSAACADLGGSSKYSNGNFED